MFLSDFLSGPNASPTVALIGVLLSIGTYCLGRWTSLRTLSAKYRDRLYELNKLTVQSGDVALAFFDPGNHSGTYFNQLYDMTPGASNATNPKSPLVIVAQVRAYVHYRINFYEEIFYATKPWTLNVFEDSKVWRAYVRAQINSQPLVRELLRKDRAKFGKRFVDFSGV